MDIESILGSIKSPRLHHFIKEAVKLCTPDRVHLCDGSDREFNELADLLVHKGVFVRLNSEKRPNSYWCHTDPSDTARVEEATFICSYNQDDAGPTNNWKDPTEMKQILGSLFRGCMKGRTLYVVPFCMGIIGSDSSCYGVQITDSPYVVCSMKIMTVMGQQVMEHMKDSFFVPCMHSVGAPLLPGEEDVSWPCNKDNKYIVHFPEEKTIWSFGSGYGGNALLGKKSLALRIASVLGKEQGWLAEHMLILGITSPKGEKKYFAAAFPSACGKTNLALMLPKLEGWKIECVGDDIAWMRWGNDGRLYAVNPEAGFFGVATGTSEKSNPNAMKMISKNTVFTNVALTHSHDVWWEGMTKEPPESLTSWKGTRWEPTEGPAAHPNSRFTVAASQCPVIDPLANDPKGVPISAIIFGGRRSDVIPLVSESFDWEHGIFYGSTISSETTAATAGEVGKLRHDPFAMLAFCGYNMGDYLSHWLKVGSDEKAVVKPKFFYVNWFQKDSKGNFIWPGFGDNIRVLKWIFERCDDKAEAVKTPVGYVPTFSSLDTAGLDLSDENKGSLLCIDKKKWEDEAKNIEDYFSQFSYKLPFELHCQLQDLKKRLKDASCGSKSACSKCDG
ncbi:MAG: phosphoenolpyruvate carboxykinase (GTP) [Chlamydiae bacterium]|nr:phosphoenolpyruvate carboxykinase (GTP) [Chlamydiota bacterium]